MGTVSLLLSTTMNFAHIHNTGIQKNNLLRLLLYVGIILPFFFVSLYSQTNQEDSTLSGEAKSTNSASIGFDKLLNRYNWDTRLLYANTFGPFSLNVHQRFLSSLIMTEKSYIRDENNVDLEFKHTILPRLKGIVRAGLYTLSDDQNVAFGKAGTQSFQYGIEAMPVSHLAISPTVGLRYDHQAGIRDNGLVYGVGINSSGLEIGGYNVLLNGLNERALLSPRLLETFRDTIGLQKIFYQQTEALFSFSFFRNRRDFYQGIPLNTSAFTSTMPDIESRTENAFQFTTDINYSANRSLSMLFHGTLFTRNVGRGILSFSGIHNEATMLNPNINEFRLQGDVMLRYNPSSSFFVSTGISLLEREEQHSVDINGIIAQAKVDSATRFQEMKNNQALRASLFLDVMNAVTSSDTVKLSLSNSLLRYDTPSLQNDDDRDELRHNIRLETRHGINQYLFANVTAEVSLTHLVYLRSLRSSENTWNRIIRLAPRLVYIPSKSFVTANTFEVLANYTVYDFEYLSSSVRSFTFRQFAWVDSTVYFLTKRLAIEWFNNVRLYERGELQWAEFSERPLTYIDERTYTGGIQYNVSELLVFSVGIRYFSQSRFTYKGSEKQEDFFLRTLGPMTAIKWSAGNNTHLLVKGWYESLLQTNQIKSTNANVSLQCTVQL